MASWRDGRRTQSGDTPGSGCVQMLGRDTTVTNNASHFRCFRCLPPPRCLVPPAQPTSRRRAFQRRITCPLHHLLMLTVRIVTCRQMLRSVIKIPRMKLYKVGGDTRVTVHHPSPNVFAVSDVPVTPLLEATTDIGSRFS